MSAPEEMDVVVAAARNNAELCSLVCRSHGIDGVFAADAWTSARRTPPLYPDAVTLDARADTDEVLGRIDLSAGASVKDSFATLDLTPFGFRILFSAEWIARAPGALVGHDDGISWSIVSDPAGLVAWEAARSGTGPSLGVFRPELLSAPDFVLLRGESGGELVAGVIANASARVVGISNLFAPAALLGDAWAGALDAISIRFPDREIVGYESDEMLDAARRVGFRSIGPLRVWIKD